MVEGTRKEDEPRLEFDSAGQAIAYTQLDQARVLALQHTGDNGDFYGRPYRDLFNLMYKGRPHQQDGITGVFGVPRFVFVSRFSAASPSRIV